MVKQHYATFSSISKRNKIKIEKLSVLISRWMCARTVFEAGNGRSSPYSNCKFILVNL